MALTCLASVCVVLCVAVICPLRTVLGIKWKDSTTDATTRKTSIRCPKRDSKLIIYSAEFSPASKQFCDPHSCRSIDDTNNSECVVAPGRLTGRKLVCNRKFTVKDVWRVYEWCKDKIGLGQTCRLNKIDGLSQMLPKGGEYLVQYHCVEDASNIDPCSAVKHGSHNDLYHVLTSSQVHRQCTCTGRVQFREGVDRESILLHISYLIMVVSSSSSSSSSVSSSSKHFQDAMRATVTSEKGEEKLNVSSTPDFLITMVTQQSPFFVLTLKLHESRNFSGFVWLHIRDREVNLACSSSGDLTATTTARPTDITAVITTSTTSVGTVVSNADVNWVTVTAIIVVSGVFAVVFILVISLLVMKRRASRQPLIQYGQRPNHGRAETSSSHIVSPYAYAEASSSIDHNSSPISHHHHHHDNHAQHHLHHPCASPSSHTYAEPVSSSTPLTGNDVTDNNYAKLGRQGEGHGRAGLTGSGNDAADTYDHVTRGRGEEYQELKRDSFRRQVVIDNVYDHTMSGCHS